jgi:cytochrome c
MKLLLALFIALAVTAALLQGGDAGQGKELFEKRCAGCHDLDKNKEGPHLRGIYGRAAGKVESFDYSDGMKAAKFTWDDESLNKWLSNPDDVVKDNDMAFRLEDAAERASVIAYLKTLSSK